MVNWDSEDIRKFKKQARATQQEYEALLGDRQWDVIEPWKWTILRRKVGFGLYGPPQMEPNSENRNTGYKKEQLDQIEKICDQLVDDLNFKEQSILFACVFIVGKIWDKHFVVPVFKAKRDRMNVYWCNYVDSSARKYSSWTDDYLQKNKLPKCVYCYPTLGKYERNSNDEVCVSFGTSPACDLVNRVFSVCDNIATFTTIGTSIIGIAALCAVPIAAPIIAASAVASVSTGAYGAARSGHALYDRATHSQSIDISDADARSCWLSIVGSSLGFAQGRMVSSMTEAAKAGEVLNKAGRIAFVIIQTGSLTLSGIGIIHSLADLIDKTERNQLTSLDVFQFSTSILFFTNSLVNVKTASTIIKEVQHDIIENHRKYLSPEAKKLFNKHTGQLRGPREMHGNANVVKQLNRIENAQHLYEMMVNKNVKNYKVNLYIMLLVLMFAIVWHWD